MVLNGLSGIVFGLAFLAFGIAVVSFARARWRKRPALEAAENGGGSFALMLPFSIVVAALLIWNGIATWSAR